MGRGVRPPPCPRAHGWARPGRVRWPGARSRGLFRPLRFGTPGTGADSPGTRAGPVLSRFPAAALGAVPEVPRGTVRRCPSSLRAVTSVTPGLSPPERPSLGNGSGAPRSPVSVKPGVPRGTCQSASVPPLPRTLPAGTSALPGGMASGIPPSKNCLPRISLGMPWAEPSCPTAVLGRGAGGCRGVPGDAGVPRPITLLCPNTP